MNNQSLDRVRKLDKILDNFLSTTIRYQKGQAVGVTIYGIDRSIDAINDLINSELQNLRQELAREIERLKKSNALKRGQIILSEDGKSVDAKYLNQAGAGGYNEAIDKVLAIIKGEK